MLRSLTCPAGAPQAGLQERQQNEASWQDTVHVLLPCGVQLLDCELRPEQNRSAFRVCVPPEVLPPLALSFDVCSQRVPRQEVMSARSLLLRRSWEACERGSLTLQLRVSAF